MDFEHILYDVRDQIATITLNRPNKRNALSTALYGELDQTYDAVAGDPEVRVLVIRGAGPSFCAGNDMSEPCFTLHQWQDRLRAINRRTMKLWSLEKPTIAMIHGYCMAAGCEMALACDVTIAGADAKFGEPEIRHGSMAQLLIPWYLHPKLAKEFIFTGDTIDAEEAYRIGMVNKVYPSDRLEEETYKLARKLAKIPPDATRLNKRAMNKAFEIMGMRPHGEYVDEVSTILHVMMFAVQDEAGQELQKIKYEQGVKAFLQAREARFEE